MDPQNAKPAMKRALRAAGLTAEIDAHLRERHQKSLVRDRLWAEASALGMPHTELARIADVHHKRVDEAVKRANGAGHIAP